MADNDFNWLPLSEEYTEDASLPGAPGSISTKPQPAPNTGASLSGPVVNPASRSGGLGGTQSTPALMSQSRQMTPEELMKLADEMEAQIAAQKETLRDPSSVEPALERETGVPFWLRQYMQGQPAGDPYGQSPTNPERTREEAISGNRYLTDAEKEAYRNYRR